MIKRFVPSYIFFLLSLFGVLMALFTLFRYITLLYNRPDGLYVFQRTLTINTAFKIGFLFDVTVASYGLLLPFVVLSGLYLMRKEHKLIQKAIRIYCLIALAVALIICAADVPYFHFFNSRLNVAALSMKNLGQVIRYVFTEISYYPFIIMGLGGIYLISQLVNWLWVRTYQINEQSFFKNITTCFLSLGFLMIGLWGGTTPKLPSMTTSIFSNDGFINQLSLNPVHTWFDSYVNFDITNCTLAEAEARVQKSHNITNALPGSPIAQLRSYKHTPEKPYNVVLVLMESMSTYQMGLFGNSKNLTPGLDSLAMRSLFFDKCYANGIHTNTGIYSTLYSMPIYMMQHPMNNGISEYTTFSGLPVTLKEKGYHTTFMCTHKKSFDNLDVFLQKNGYNEISDITDYPQDKEANSWGVGDETLFENALSKLDKYAAHPSGKPFFTTIMTITAHPPFTLPAFTKFKPRSSDPRDVTYEYADWAVKNFMDSCATKPWYDNTIFVLVGDHGLNLHGPYDVPLSYSHVPLIIHAPGILGAPEINHGLANQTDIFPTVMGILQQDYVQNTFGYDLRREKRPFAVFSHDHKLAVINDKYLYVARKSGRATLTQITSSNGTDISKQLPLLADSMKNYAFSMLHVSQTMIKSKQTHSFGNEK